MSESIPIIVNIDINNKELKVDKKIVYTVNIINQHNTDIRNIILDIEISQKVFFIRGEIQRQRGILEIEECTNLIIGNLAPEEQAKVIVEVELKNENFLKENIDESITFATPLVSCKSIIYSEYT